MQVTKRTWHMREHVYQALYSPRLHESLGMRLVENTISLGDNSDSLRYRNKPVTMASQMVS